MSCAGGLATADTFASIFNRRFRMCTRIFARCRFGLLNFDAVICNHVLEHVPDDRAAMRELRRILRPGGIAVLMVPFRPDRQTYEDPTIVDPEQRTAVFGQFDHVRLYGSDYLDRLREAGFEVDGDLYWKSLDEDEVVRYGLQRDEYLIIGRTNDDLRGSVASSPSWSRPADPARGQDPEAAPA